MGKIRRKENMENMGNTGSMGIMWNKAKAKAFAVMLVAVFVAVFVAVLPISNETVEASDTMTWTDGDITVVYKDGTLTVSGNGEMTDYDASFEIPWYDYLSQINKIVVKKGITHVGDRSFRDTPVTEVSLPDGLLTIGEYAFIGCTSLKSLTIPDSVTKIERSAFEDCDSLTLTLPDGMRRIDDGSYIVAADVSITGTQYYDMAWEVLELVNEERAAAGVDPLVMDGELMEAAMQRAAEISTYYSHARPNGLSWTSILFYKIQGENICTGYYSSASSVMEVWMNSAGHKRNLLYDDWQSIGVGCFQTNGHYYWVQDFGTKESDTKATITGSYSKSVTVTLNVSMFSDCLSLRFSPSSTSSSPDSIYVGKKGTYKVLLKNPILSSSYALLDPGSVSWTVGNSSIATASSSGKVTGKAAGSTTVTVTLSALKQSASTDVKIRCKSPEISVSNTKTGVKIKWSAVTGAAKYQVSRKVSGGSWEVLGTTTSTSYTDKTAKNAKTYYYRVRCVKSDGTTSTSGYSSSENIRRLIAGTISGLTNTASGIKVTWKKVSGATGYYIYRKTATGTYKKVKTITGASTVSWTDTAVKSKTGKAYTYAVKAYYKTDSKTYTGSYTGKSKVRVASSTISSLTNTSKGIKVKWKKVTGADGYIIYRKTSSGSYKKVKTIKDVSTVSWTDTAVKDKNGKSYTYKVVSYVKKDSTTYKASATGKKTVRLTAVSLSSVKSSSSGAMTVTVKTANSKATGYQIQYSTSKTFAGGNETYKVTPSWAFSEKITGLAKGKTYYVRVRAYKTVNGKTYYSAWSSKKSVKVSK